MSESGASGWRLLSDGNWYAPEPRQEGLEASGRLASDAPPARAVVRRGTLAFDLRAVLVIVAVLVIALILGLVL
jgi:hypothetical protein